MTPVQVFALASNSLALMITLSVGLLVIFQRPRSRQTLGQFLGSLALLQSGTLLTLTARLADLPDTLIENLFNITLIGFFLVTLTGLALLLHMANAMKDAWVLLSRTGVATLIVLQPALWDHRLFRFADPLDTTLMGSPYTHLGQIAAGTCALYLGSLLVAGWRYWDQIAAPLLVAPVMGLGAIQLLMIISGTLRELALTGTAGGIASLMLGYYLIEYLGFDPGTSQARWMKASRALSQAISDTRQLDQTLADLAALARRLTRADAVTILRAVDSHQLEIVAMAGEDSSLVGRKIRSGEGLAGRVMQTLSPMRIDNYHVWNGRITAFDDVPIYAIVSVPLIYNGKLVGAINAHQTSPGRVFTNREQAILEWLAPQAAIMLAAARLDRDLGTTQAYLRAVMDHNRAAVMIFDSAGKLCESNTAAQRVLRILVDDSTDSIMVTRVVEHAQNENFIYALARWMADPAFMPSLEVDYPSIGSLIVDLRTITLGHSKPALLMIMHEPREWARLNR